MTALRAREWVPYAPVFPRLPNPDTTGVRELLAQVGVQAHLTAWTGWCALTETQSSAGVWVFTLPAGPETRAIALDALLDAGYVCEEREGTIQVDLERGDWVAVR